MRIKFFAILFLAFLYSCKKDKSDDFNYWGYHLPPGQFNLDSALKDYLFKKGTFWIYIDSSSGKKDSISVYRDSTYLETNSANKTFHYISYCRNYSSLKDYIQDIYGNIFIRSAYPIGQYRSIYNCSKKINTSIYGCTYMAYFDSIQFDNKWFYKVKQMRVDRSTPADNYIQTDMDFYFSPGIGVVRIDKLNANLQVIESKNLSKWQVIPYP